MEPTGEDWRTPGTRALVGALLSLRTEDELERFLRDLCTLGELRDLAQRWAVVRLLDEGLHYADISHRTGASTATITRIASWLHHGRGGYTLALERTSRAGDASGATTPAGTSPSPAPATAAPTQPGRLR